MTLAFIMLAVGGILLGGAWSFARQKKPMPIILIMVVAALLCIAVSLYRINYG